MSARNNRRSAGIRSTRVALGDKNVQHRAGRRSPLGLRTVAVVDAQSLEPEARHSKSLKSEGRHSKSSEPEARSELRAGKAPVVNTRGYQKIATANRTLKVDFCGRMVLDIGSSTGGFTQYALEQGAAKVIAIERGTNQMTAPLRYDPRVELHEKTDIFTVTTAASPHSAAVSYDLAVPHDLAVSHDPAASCNSAAPHGLTIAVPDLILADVSFISLTKVLMYARINLARPQTRYLVMFKPQFEAQPSQLTPKGVVKNSKVRRTIIGDFELWLKTHGFVVLGKCDNALTGRHGNLERFYYLASER